VPHGLHSGVDGCVATVVHAFTQDCSEASPCTKTCEICWPHVPSPLLASVFQTSSVQLGCLHSIQRSLRAQALHCGVHDCAATCWQASNHDEEPSFHTMCSICSPQVKGPLSLGAGVYQTSLVQVGCSHHVQLGAHSLHSGVYDDVPTRVQASTQFPVLWFDA